MAFDGLDEASDDQTTDSDEETTANTTETKPTEDPEETIEQTNDTDPYEKPAFGYDSDMQTALYARPKTAEAFEDALEFDVNSILKRENSVKNVAGREYGDAVLRLAADHPELVAQYVMDARGLDVDDLDNE